MMPQPSRYTFLFTSFTTVEGVTYNSPMDVCPDNWEAFEMGIMRQQFGMSREITAELIFSGTASALLQALYAVSKHQSLMTMKFEKRLNDWTFAEFNTFKVDFSTYSITRGKVSITMIENSVRSLIDENKGTEYEFPLPNESGTADFLEYEGISYDKTNRLFIQPPVPTPTAPASSFKLAFISSSWDALKSRRTVRETSSFYSMPYTQDAGIRFLAACTPVITVKAGFVSIGCTSDMDPGAHLGVIRRSTTGSVIELTDNNGDNVVFPVGSYAMNTNGTVNKKIINFTIDKTITITNKKFTAGEEIIFCVGVTGAPANSIWIIQARGTSMQIQSVEPSLIVNRSIPIVSHEWLIEKILRKMVPQFADTVAYPTASILDYKLPTFASEGFSIGLTSSAGLSNDETPTIKCSFERVLKSLGVQYGADYDVTGNLVRVDYPSTFFTSEKAMDVEPIGAVTIKMDTTHLYNKITVGYETSDDCVNGAKEYNCKNVFSIPNTGVDKELKLVSPFIGSPFTIEQHLTDKDASSTGTNADDNNIFVFAVNKVVDHSTTLYRVPKQRIIGYYRWDESYGYRFYDLLNMIITPSTDYNYQDAPTGLVYAWDGAEYLLDDTDANNLPTKAYNTVISPSQILIANMAYIAISLGVDKLMTFASTDRKADYFQSIDGVVYYENAISPDLVTAPLFKPETIEFQTAQIIDTISDINDNLYNYFSILNNNTSIVHNFYIKNITLQLTRINSQDWTGLIK